MEKIIITSPVTKLNIDDVELTVTFKDSDDDRNIKKIITELLARNNAKEIFASDSHH